MRLREQIVGDEKQKLPWIISSQRYINPTGWFIELHCIYHLQMQGHSQSVKLGSSKVHTSQAT